MDEKGYLGVFDLTYARFVCILPFRNMHLAIDASVPMEFCHLHAVGLARHAAKAPACIPNVPLLYLQMPWPDMLATSKHTLTMVHLSHALNQLTPNSY